MAAKIHCETLISVIRRSNLVEASLLDRLIGEYNASGPNFEDGPAFAAFLINEGAITRWQAEKLLQGKHKGYFLGKYRLLSLLGKGGMSSVYLAEHVLMRRRCAIKVLPQKRVADTSYLGRFHREAQAVAALDHPNIVRAYDVDHQSEGATDIHFLVMEFVDGQSLQELVQRKGVLPFREAVDYIRQAALGLAHAHTAGMVHRDVKPGNLLVDNNGVVKVLDLGLARFFSDTGDDALTIQHDEKVLGTADYLAPEQAVDSHSVDARADIYSLGCTLYFLLTGHPPFTEGTLAQRLMAHQLKTPPPVEKERPETPQDLVAIVHRLMAKKKEDRPATAMDVAEELGRWLAGATAQSGSASVTSTTTTPLTADGSVSFANLFGMGGNTEPAPSTTVDAPADGGYAYDEEPEAASSGSSSQAHVGTPKAPDPHLSAFLQAFGQSPPVSKPTSSGPQKIIPPQAPPSSKMLRSQSPAGGSETKPTAVPKTGTPPTKKPTDPSSPPAAPTKANPSAEVSGGGMGGLFGDKSGDSDEKPSKPNPFAMFGETTTAPPKEKEPGTHAAASPKKSKPAVAPKSPTPAPADPQSAPPVVNTGWSPFGGGGDVPTTPAATPIPAAARGPAPAKKKAVTSKPASSKSVAQTAAPTANPVRSNRPPAGKEAASAAELGDNPFAALGTSVSDSQVLPANAESNPFADHFGGGETAAPDAPSSGEVVTQEASEAPPPAAAPVPDFFAAANAAAATDTTDAPSTESGNPFAAVAASSSPAKSAPSSGKKPAKPKPAIDKASGELETVAPGKSGGGKQTLFRHGEAILEELLSGSPLKRYAILSSSFILIGALVVGIAWSAGMFAPKLTKSLGRYAEEQPADPSWAKKREAAVGRKAEFKTIAAALEKIRSNFKAKDDSDRFVLTIEAGTYDERIVLDGRDEHGRKWPDQITVKADGEVILAPKADPGEPVVNVQNITGFVLEGLKIQADGRSVAIETGETLYGTAFRNLTVEGFGKTGISGTNNSGTGATPFSIDRCVFQTSKSDAVGVRISTSDQIGDLEIANCRFIGSLQAGVLIDCKGTASNVTVRQNRFFKCQDGIRLSGPGTWLLLTIVNNTIAEGQNGVVFTSAPTVESSEIAIRKNLFAGLKGQDIRVQSGYSAANWKNATAGSPPLIAGNAGKKATGTDAPAGTIPLDPATNVILDQSKVAFQSESPTDPKFLMPKEALTPPASAGSRMGDFKGLGAM